MTTTTQNKEQIDWVQWMGDSLMVESKPGPLVPFVPNDIQCTIFGTMFKQWRAGYPVRIIILKARQEGASTAVQGLFYAITHTRPHVKVLVSAHDAVGAQTVFAKAKCFHANLPEGVAKGTEYNNRAEVQWSEPHGSLFKVQVAGSNLGRGGTFQLFHASELAFWEGDTVAFQSAIDTMPKNVHATAVVIESTANGDSGEFYRRWAIASKHHQQYPDDQNCFIPIFFSWMDNPEYAMEIPSRRALGPLDEEEQILIDDHHATPEQLWWRRFVIEQEYAGDVIKFHQNYPSTPEEAFISTGSHAIEGRIRREHHRTAKPPKMYARMEWADADHTQAYLEECDFDPTGCWRIWEEPQTVHEYAIGGDVAEGIPCDPANSRSETDRSTALVLKRRTLTTAALYVGRPNPDDFGVEMLKAGWFFHEAWICPEVNNAGQSTLDTIRQAGYGNLYRRHPEPADVKQMLRNKLGWRTTSTTRDRLIDMYLAACRPDADWEHVGFRDSFKCLSEELAEEEDTFIRKKTGKREHRDQYFDDILFAAMIAMEVHRECPMSSAWEMGNITTTTGRLGPEFVGGYPRRSDGGGTMQLLETT